MCSDILKMIEQQADFSLYIHIPYCLRRCFFCGFVAAKNPLVPEDYIEALLCELAMRREEWHGKKLVSIHFGGGTPSLLEAAMVGRLLEAIFRYWSPSEEIEIGFEVDPLGLTQQLCRDYYNVGINRLSIGVQSIVDKELQWLGRQYDGKHALDAIHWAQQAGFVNVSADLMFALPEQTCSSYEESITAVVHAGVKHLSAYQLTIEPNTPLEHRIRTGKVEVVDEELAQQLYQRGVEKLIELGLMQYEISNFSIGPEWISRHNWGYWNERHYLGIGVAAHSFDGARRYWNTSSTDVYCRSLAEKKFAVADEETLSPEQRQIEWIMLQLRQNHGLDFNEYTRLFGGDFHHKFAIPLSRWEALNANYPAGPLYRRTNQGIYPTTAGLYIADGLAAML